jgi:hypothetical protein
VVRRLALYRGNVIAAASRALQSAYPVVAEIVGDEFFAGSALAYWRDQPAEGGDLGDYGAGFAGFLARFEPARAMPYLADVAALEWRVHRAHFAADAASFSLAQLARRRQPDQACLALQPAAALLATEHPAVAIWQAHQHLDAAALGSALAAGAQLAMIARPQLQVTVQAVDAPTFALLLALQRGTPLGAAAEAALGIDPHFDLATTLAMIERAGVLSECGDDSTGLGIPDQA